MACHFPYDTFKCIFLNENVWILIRISLHFVPYGSSNNILALAQIMVLHRPGDEPYSEPMMVNLAMDICVTRPQWVNEWWKCVPNWCWDWNNSKRTKSVSWWLMPWLLVSPGHQQPWYWLGRISTTCVISVLRNVVRTIQYVTGLSNLHFKEKYSQPLTIVIYCCWLIMIKNLVRFVQKKRKNFQVFTWFQIFCQWQIPEFR